MVNEKLHSEATPTAVRPIEMRENSLTGLSVVTDIPANGTQLGEAIGGNSSTMVCDNPCHGARQASSR